VHVLQQPGYSADGSLAEGGVTGKARASLVVDPAAFSILMRLWGSSIIHTPLLILQEVAGEREYSVPEERPKEKLLLALSPHDAFV